MPRSSSLSARHQAHSCRTQLFASLRIYISQTDTPKGPRSKVDASPRTRISLTHRTSQGTPNTCFAYVKLVLQKPNTGMLRRILFLIADLRVLAVTRHVRCSCYGYLTTVIYKHWQLFIGCGIVLTSKTCQMSEDRLIEGTKSIAQSAGPIRIEDAALATRSKE